ncbi:hypothetical protein [Lactococcus sp. DD01]|uniref:hypothetical protein n=1 Tax=Lactococcus sp. DD01 TaxID=1776443 RepID=UPI0007769333|nr:hypothetical protein [Lactococcus sp. DD01]KXT63209.1 hypothetical protein LACDD01_00153 [Lactococcus sp. DD01]
MNHLISILFEAIAQLEENLDRYKKNYHKSYDNAIGLAEWGIEWRKEQIKEISATLNPQIPEKYASMSRDEILGGIGQCEKTVDRR